MAIVKEWCKRRALQVSKNGSKHSIMILDDISGGKELLKIPVINDVDDDKPPTINYTTEFTGLDSPAVVSVFNELKKENLLYFRQNEICGLRFLDGSWSGNGEPWDPIHLENVGRAYYSSTGDLKGTQLKAFTPLGIFECLRNPCPICKTENRRVAKGLRLPLEVFRTKYRGWGVRSRVAIPEGCFIMSYCGEVKTEAESAANGDDTYEFLYILDHFFARFAFNSI